MLGTFFEPGPFPSQSKFHNIVAHLVRCILLALLDDTLHVAAFCTYQPSGYLKVLLIVDLNVEATSVLCAILIVLIFLRILSSLIAYVRLV